MADTTAATSPTEESEEEETISKSESLRLKNLAIQTYTTNLKTALKYAKRAHRLCPTVNGVTETLTALKILTTAANSDSTPDWYKILEVEPFSHVGVVKKSYKKLALVLHPDKNVGEGLVLSEEAFKVVSEGFGVLSDEVRRKEYDVKVRIAMQDAAMAAVATEVVTGAREVEDDGGGGGAATEVMDEEEGGGGVMVEEDGGGAVTAVVTEAKEVEDGGGGCDGDGGAVETFWTVCMTCRMMHLFVRKYLGCKLLCPVCKTSFKAVEVEGGEDVDVDVVGYDDEDDEEEEDGGGAVTAVETFWTVCFSCRMMHLFVRKYLGCKLMCPNCKTGFKAVEVDSGEKGDVEVDSGEKEDVDVVGDDAEEEDDDDGGAVTEVGVDDGGGGGAVETFWTVCMTCRMMHLFVRKYLGCKLLCPVCKTSFKAVEVEGGEDVDVDVVGYDDDEEDEEDDGVLKRCEGKRKMSSVGDIMKRSEGGKNIGGLEKEGGSKRLRVVDDVESEGRKVRKSGRLKENGSRNRYRMMMKDDEEMMTLAEMQKLVNDNEDDDADNDSEEEDDDEDDETVTLAQMQKLVNDENSDDADYDIEEDDDVDDDEEDDDEEMMTLAKMQKLVKTNVKDGKLKVHQKGKAQRSESTHSNSKNKDLEIMTVEDSDFYDFDEGRVEKSFKKGQIWALYDDDDGMPRHYGLINEVVSTHSFEVNMSWLDPQSNGDDVLISLEKTGFHISCGRFKVSSKISVTSLNVFSHIVNCDRAAREIYRIYPKKGSVWALYDEHVERGSPDKRRYDIVVFLTSYSEVHGLSMAYLEKVNGFKTTFKRREIGCHAIKWLEKHQVQLFSHQIPARKLSEEEVPDISGDCWELDPASLPTQLLAAGQNI